MRCMFSKSSQVQHIRRWDMVWSTEDEFGQRSSAEHCCITLFSQGGAPPPLWTVALVPPLDEVRCETRHVVSKTTTPSVRLLCMSCWGHHGEKRCIYYVHIELRDGHCETSRPCRFLKHRACLERRVRTTAQRDRGEEVCLQKRHLNRQLDQNDLERSLHANGVPSSKFVSNTRVRGTRPSN